MLAIVIDCFPQHHWRAMSNPLSSNCSHSYSHCAHLVKVLLIAIRPNGAISINDTANEPHVDFPALRIGEITRMRQLQPYLITKRVNVADQLIQDGQREVVSEIRKKYSCVSW